MVLMNRFAGQQWRHRPKEQTYGHRQGGEWKERVGQMESSVEAYTLPYVDSQWKFTVLLRELKLVLCDNLEEWDGVGVGREVQEGGNICIPMADSC